MSAHLGDILKKLGWNDGFQMPIANDENKALEEELASLSLRKTKAKNTWDIISGRLDALKEHIKFVTQENEQTQRLITAHKQQLEATENQYHITKAEKENTEHSSKTILKQLKESEERFETKKTDLQKSVYRADQLKAEMDWDAEALKAWEESLKKRDDDNELIKKFSKEDERRYNMLEAKRQHLQLECAEMKKKAAKIATEANNCELIIERTGKVVKQLMKERQSLIDRWKETVKMLQQRDNDIVKTQEQISSSLELVEKQEEKLAENNAFLKNEQRNNHDIELELQNLNAINSRMRRDLNDLTQHMLLLNTELHSLKRQVASTAQHLENERIKGKLLTHTIDERHSLCGKYQEDIVNIQKKLNEMKTSGVNSEERIRRIEKMIDNEESLYTLYMTDTEKTNGLLFRLDYYLLEQKDIGKNIELQINNATCNCSQLRKHIRIEKKNLEKSKEVVYDMEFRIDDIERKLYRIDNHAKHDEYADENEKKIQELEKTLAEHKDVQHALQNQVDRLQEEMRKLANVIAADKELLAVLKSKCENHLLVYEIGQKQINAAKAATQEKQVEENMIRLRIGQIEKEKRNEEKQMFTLEKLRLNLNQAMKERQLEINTKTAIIQTTRRSLDEDRGRLKADIALRRLKIEQIQKKYHINLMALGKDKDGEPFSVSHFKIKNAQEKFILQQEGDELDQKIKVAEQEIVAMENTLKLVNLTNASFRNSLAPVKDDELQTEMQSRETSIKECQDSVDKLEEELNSVKRQELDKSEKLKRTECNLKKVIKKLGNKNVCKFLRDFEIRQIKDVNNSVLKQLLNMPMSYQEMTPLINRYMMEYNIQLPTGQHTSSTSGTSYSSLDICSISSDGISGPTFSGIQSLSTVNLSFRF